MNKKSTATLGEILYYIAMCIILLPKGIGLDEGMFSFRLLLLAGCSVMACKMLLDEYNIGEVIVIGILVLWGIFSVFHLGSLGIFIYIILMIGMKNVELSRIFKIGGAFWGVCMFATISAAFWGNRKGVQLVHEKFGLGPVLRESLGYTHPNVLHVSYVVLMAFILYSCEKKGKELLKVILLLLTGDIILFIYSLSTTGLMMSLFLLVLYCYLNARQRLNLFERSCLFLFVPICVFLSVILPLMGGDGKAFVAINKIFNNRLLAIRVYFINQGLSFWGESLQIPGYSLDNSYAYALIEYGIAFFVVIIVAYCFLMNFLIKRNMKKEIAILCAFMWGGLSEPFLFNTSIKNITIFFMGYFLYSPKLFLNTIKIPLLKRWNREINISIPIYKNGNSVWRTNKPVMRGIVLILIIIGISIIALPRHKVTEYYVARKSCDYEADLVILPKEKRDGMEWIGNVEESDRVYYFTNSNSNLVWLQEKKEYLGRFTYLVADIYILFFIFKGNKKEKNEQGKESN